METSKISESFEATINGVRIHYERIGTGLPVLFLHGWGANLHSFSRLYAYVSKRYTCIGLDFPGFGQSDEPQEVWGVSEYADFILSFLAHLNAIGTDTSKIVLAGHSFGGRVLIKLASKKDLPFGITNVILFDAAGILPRRGLKYHLRVKTYKLGKRILILPFIKAMFPHTLESFKKRFGSSDYASASPMMRSCMVRVVNEDLTHHLPDISAPVLLIWGETDKATPISDAKLMERLIPNAGLVVVKNAGHFSFLDQPDFCNRVVGSLLKI